jgi:hypothetical protein
MTKHLLGYLSIFSFFFILQIEDYQSTYNCDHRVPTKLHAWLHASACEYYDEALNEGTAIAARDACAAPA